MMRRMMLISTLSAALLVSGTVLAQPPQRGGPGARGDRMIRHLGLNDQQAQQMRQLHENLRRANEPLFDAIKKQHQLLTALWKADTLDRQAILRVHAGIGQLKEKAMRNRLEMHFQLHGILTPEQRVRMADHMARKMGRFHRGPHGDRGGRGGCGGPGGCDGAPDVE